VNNQMLLRRLEEVIVTDATDTSPAEFLATHIPFKNLYYTSSGIGENIEKEITEDIFLKEYMISSMEYHNLTIVEGPSGSGKSHFIRWLMEEYETEKEASDLTIPIRRHQNTLKGAIEQILKVSIFDEKEQELILEKLLLAQEHLNDEELIYYIKNNLLTKLEAKRDFEGDKIKRRQNDKLIEFIKSTYVFDHLLSIEGGPFWRLYRKISSNNQNIIQGEFNAKFQAEDFNVSLSFLEQMEDISNDCNRNTIGFARELYRDICKEGTFRQDVADYLNSMLDQVIQMCLNLSGEDFKHIFYEIRKELKLHNKTLTLFIEDITSFTGIDKSLLEALLVDHQGQEEICRLYSVVGTTSSYYTSFVPDNIKQRVTGRIMINEDSIFKKEEDLIQMAARYLNAINISKETLLDWYKDGAKINQLPIAHIYDEEKWSLFKDDILGVVSLFPFNQTALLNLYDTMKEKTPRVFLKEIIKYVYRLYLVEPNQFPGPWRDFENYYKVPRWKEDLHEQLVEMQSGKDAEKISCILRVWGDGTAYYTKKGNQRYLGNLPEQIFTTFNTPFIQGKSGMETIPVPNEKSVKPILTKGDLHAQGRTTVTIEPEVNPYKEASEKLSNWYDKKQPLTIHKDLRKDVASALDAFVDWPEEIPIYLVKKFFGTGGNGRGSILRISIEGQSVAINEEGLILKRSSQDYNLLKALLGYRYLGKGSWAYETSLDHIVMVQEWADTNKGQLVDLITKSQKKKQWPILELGVCNQYSLLSIEGEITEKESIEELYSKIMHTRLLGENIKHSREWNKGISRIKEEAITENAKWVIRLYNILQGEANLETSKLFIDAEKIIKIIKELKKQGWQLDIENIMVTSNPIYRTYQLYKDLQVVKEYIVEKEAYLLQDLIKQIKQYVDFSDVHRSFFRIKSFLTQFLLGNKEHYIEDDFKMVLKNSDEEIDEISKNIQQAIIFSKEEGLLPEQVLIRLSKLSLIYVEQYVDLLKNIDKKLQGLEIKYLNQAKTQKVQAQTYLNTKENVKSCTKIAYQYLQRLGGH